VVYQSQPKRQIGADIERHSAQIATIVWTEEVARRLGTSVVSVRDLKSSDRSL
jgi:hypothetical protein